MRLIDGDELIAKLYQDQPMDWTGSDAEVQELNDWELFRNMVDNAPTVDAKIVVRCKDCEHAERYERTDGTAGYYCGHPQNSFTYGERWDRVFKPVKETDGFCSYGARKDEENG